VDNPAKIDWHLRAGMTSGEYAAALAADNKEGLSPLDVRAYGTDASTRYAAVWVRYRAPK
jgi:hypothetical protein